MNRKILKKMADMNRKVNRDTTESTREVLSAVKKHLAGRGYRADLRFVAKSNPASTKVMAEVRYRSDLGYPAEKDLLAITAQEAPQYDIVWEAIDVNPDLGVVYLDLEPSVETVPVASVNSIPDEFISIGAGVYKKAADNSDSIMEIWNLQKTDDGLALIRSNEDMEISAEDDGEIKAGQVVDTPSGPGVVKRLDDLGNAFVQIGKNLRHVAQSDMQPYDVNKEKQKLIDYYTAVYGDANFAQALTEEYGDK